jgi:hypothetical protein
VGADNICRARISIGLAVFSKRSGLLGIAPVYPTPLLPPRAARLDAECSRTHRCDAPAGVGRAAFPQLEGSDLLVNADGGLPLKLFRIVDNYSTVRVGSAIIAGLSQR